MSGDGHPKDQPLNFKTDEMTTAKKILLNKNQEVIEIQGVMFQKRWRTGSPMQG